MIGILIYAYTIYSPAIKHSDEIRRKLNVNFTAYFANVH